nr:MAG TPA: hypothetical protein [Caudoviricetes sp.]
MYILLLFHFESFVTPSFILYFDIFLHYFYF